MTGTGIAPGSLITAEGQVQWGELLIGPGTPLHLAAEGLTGWFDLPELDSSDAPRPWQHGSWTGARWAQPRVIGASVWLLGEDRDDTARALDLFARATAPGRDEQWLAVRIHGRTHIAKARLHQRALPADRQLVVGNVAKAAVQWICADPHRYELAEQSATTPLPRRGAGMTYPLNYPLVYGGTTVTGSVLAVNSGNTPAWSAITITGPVRQPRLVNRTTGLTLEYDLILGPGERLAVDTSEGTVVLADDRSSRLHTATSRSIPEQSWVLAPGDNLIDFRAADAEPAARLDLAWRSAFL
ncbi:phage tail family protein [Embleya sp. NBC_00888]|uniref:phage tail protein n=1 Tax=Embleya sp. NBC_00888 TaxID=2975960 RepID=UPI003867EA10|nr:phage tail family protein [Embleya sp. NBC_00888]